MLQSLVLSIVSQDGIFAKAVKLTLELSLTITIITVVLHEVP
jgi:hypothetical protein